MADPFVNIPDKIFRAIRDKVGQNSAVFRTAEWFLQSYTYDTFEFHINYDNLNVSLSKPVTLDRSVFTNCTSQTNDETWQRSTSTQDSYSWTNQTGWKLGVSLSDTIPLPITSNEVAPTFEYSGQDSTTKTLQVTRSWQIGTTFHVAPHRQVTAEWLVFEDEFKTNFTGTIRPDGMQVVTLVRITIFPNAPAVELTWNVDDFLTPEERTFQSTGTFSAVQGNRAVINVSETAAKCERRFELPFETGKLSTESQRSMEKLQELVAAAKNKTQFQFRLDIWDDTGTNIVEHIASVDDFEIAQAAYTAAVKRSPAARIIMRQGARTVQDSGPRGKGYPPS